MKEHPNHDLDLGDNHWLDWLLTDWKTGQRCGAFITHLKPDGSLCEGAVAWGPTKWQQEHPEHVTDDVRRKWWILEGAADEHITLSPSILCIPCGDHGYIRDGKWVRA